MFSSFLDSNNKLLVSRLARAQAKILALSLSTKEEYLAQVTSIVNAVINTGYGMQELSAVAAGTPAIVGDVVANMETLNDDAADIAAEIGRLEDNASTFFNLCAAARNSIGQQIREAIYASTASRFIEQFVNLNQVDPTSTCNIDLNAGVAQLPLSLETVLSPGLSIGGNSVGFTSDSVTALSDADAETLFTWNGSVLEIIVTFSQPTVVNRLKVAPQEYVGYAITTFSASADGSSYDDILGSLGVEEIVLDAAAGKYSGATVVDFTPVSAAKIRLVLQNLVSTDPIGIRSLSFVQRSYEATGNVVSSAQTFPTGQVTLSVDQSVDVPYVSVTHQISGDSVHYTTVLPGVVTLPARWWYRAVLSRSDQAFAATSSSVAANTADPTVSTGYTLVSSASVPLGNGSVQRTLVFSAVTSVIQLAETPLPNTLQVSQGTLFLNASQFSVNTNDVLTLPPGTGARFTVSYQTTASSTQDIPSLQNYYTPLLKSVQLSK